MQRENSALSTTCSVQRDPMALQDMKLRDRETSISGHITHKRAPEWQESYAVCYVCLNNTMIYVVRANLSRYLNAQDLREQGF